MDTAYISALSALAGSVVGGATSGLTTWMSLRSQAQAGRAALTLTRMQDLFRDFIILASKLYGDALVSSEPKLQEAVEVYALISRMRVMCSPRIVAQAEKVMTETTAVFSAPNRTVHELQDMMRTGIGIDPLKQFSEAAREELLSLG